MALGWVGGKHLLEPLTQANFEAPTLIHSALIWPWLWKGLFGLLFASLAREH